MKVASNDPRYRLGFNAAVKAALQAVSKGVRADDEHDLRVRAEMIELISGLQPDPADPDMLR